MKLVTLWATLCLVASAQSRQFDVASVKHCQGNDVGGGGSPTPGRLAMNCVTLASLIRMAYLAFPTGQPNVPVSPTFLQQPLAGEPAWIESERYRIDATASGPTNSEMMRGPMLQVLLEERFQLRVHREMKETNVFELAAAKSGTKLAPAKEGSCGADPCGILHRNLAGGFDIPGVTMADLSHRLTAYVDRDIVDKTAIAGVFDVHLDITPEDLESGDGSVLAVALGKLGVQMRPGKALAPMLVIDHVERPSEN
jgi:uncharacterized protein (TIGR03435 family)